MRRLPRLGVMMTNKWPDTELPEYDSDEYVARFNRIGKAFGHDTDKAVDRIMELEVEVANLRATITALSAEKDKMTRVAKGCGEHADRMGMKYREAKAEVERLRILLATYDS